LVGRREKLAAASWRQEVQLVLTATNQAVEIWETPPGLQRVLVGLVGRGIQLSRTPAMHEAEGEANGLVYIYRLLDTDRMGDSIPQLADMLSFAEHFGFNGLNVTFPYKQEIIPLLNELSGEAEALGSVNTVVLRGGRRIGHNTDMVGFKESFRNEMAGAGRDRVLLLGTGGAGAAVAHALLDSGVEQLLLHDVEESKVDILSTRLAARFDKARIAGVTDLAAAAMLVDGIVNATPVGMAKLPGSPLDPALLRPACWVADIVYFPLETELLAQARRRGCRTMSGEGMAVHQAALAFELFTGISPDVGRMRTTFGAFKEEPAGQRQNVQ
jgi:shikimate dehydrogenase